MTTVTVTVTRNEHQPRFEREEFRVENFAEKSDIGTSVAQLQASDSDQVDLDLKVF